MEERIQPPLVLENGKYPQSLMPAYTATFQQQNKDDEWNLSQILAVVRRRVFLVGGVAIAVCATVWFGALSRQPEYEGRFRLLVEPVTVGSNLAGLTQSGTANQSALDYDTQIQVLQSPQLIGPIIAQISLRYPDINYGSLVSKLKIVRFQETKIIEIYYQDLDSQKIQFVMDKLAEGYLKYSLQERQTNLRQGIQFVNSQLPKLRSRVNNLQTEVQRFRQRHNFINPESKAEQLSQQVSAVKGERLGIQTEIAVARAMHADLQSRSGLELADPPELYTNLKDRSGATEPLKQAPLYQKLVSDLRNLDSQIAVESARFQSDNPAIQMLEQKRQNLLSVLRTEAGRALGNKLMEVKSQISLLEVQAAKTGQVESNLNQQIEQMPTLARQYTDLQRELNVATQSLTRFLEKQESLQIETAQKEVPWQLIAPPRASQAPIASNTMQVLTLGAITSLLAGIGAALLLEKLDDAFHVPDELKEVTKLPLLGVVPFHKHLQELASIGEVGVETGLNGNNGLSRRIAKAQGESYPFLEAFRSLHTNIGFLSSDAPIHSLVISSSVHDEGKSTVAIHLAQAAAAMGQRVLLVDADLRQPRIHTLLDLPNEQGLSDFISTKLAFSKVVQRSPSLNKLFILTAGQIPPDPTKLLSSKKMQYIMEQFRQLFDVVIYDTSPSLGLADSSLLATSTSGIVLVIRTGKTNRSVLMKTLEQLRISRATVLGTVFNGVENHNTGGYRYYY